VRGAEKDAAASKQKSFAEQTPFLYPPNQLLGAANATIDTMTRLEQEFNIFSREMDSR
jgi:hypothetical protein